MNATRLVTIAFALALLAGCGNKGPLVLPTPPAPIDPATVPEAPTEEAVPAETPAEPPATEPVEDGTDTTTTPPDVPATTPAPTDGDGHA